MWIFCEECLLLNNLGLVICTARKELTFFKAYCQHLAGANVYAVYVFLQQD